MLHRHLNHQGFTLVAIDDVIGRGKRQAQVWTCDLSKEYVSINAEYHT